MDNGKTLLLLSFSNRRNCLVLHEAADQLSGDPVLKISNIVLALLSVLVIVQWFGGVRALNPSGNLKQANPFGVALNDLERSIAGVIESGFLWNIGEQNFPGSNFNLDGVERLSSFSARDEHAFYIASERERRQGTEVLELFRRAPKQGELN